MIRTDLPAALRGRKQIVPEIAAEIGFHALDEALSEREIEVLREVCEHTPASLLRSRETVTPSSPMYCEIERALSKRTLRRLR
jgi:hypothetical protein